MIEVTMSGLAKNPRLNKKEVLLKDVTEVAHGDCREEHKDNKEMSISF